MTQRPLLALLVLTWPAPDAAAADFTKELAAALRSPSALQSRVRFDRITTADGLSHNAVFAILQDRHGFLWFGTQGGLNRYDGYRVTQYRHDPRDPHSLGSDFVYVLLEDSNGAIWTGSQVLTKFDPQTETFTRFELPQGQSAGGRHWQLQSMCEDRAGFLWLGMSGGRSLYRFDPRTAKLDAFDLGGPMADMADHEIKSILRDRSGILWLGASGGLIRFDPTAKSSTHYVQHGARIRSIAQDQAGNLWLASAGSAPNSFNPVTGAFARRWGRGNRILPDTETSAILAGADGMVWLGTPRGLEVFDSAQGTFAVLRRHAADRSSLSADEVLSLAVDRDGSLWVGTKEGVNRFAPGTLRFGAWRRNPADPDSLGDDNVRAIRRDNAGVLWVGTYDGGLNRFNPVSGKFTHFRHDPGKAGSLDNDRVYTIYEDRSGDLWIGTSLGINRLNRRTGAFTRYRRDERESNPQAIPTYSLLEDSRGTLWFGFGESRATLDRRTGAVRAVANTGGLSMHEDRGGNLWFASQSNLTRMDSAGEVRRVTLPQSAGANTPASAQINFMHEDAQGLLWFAAETGLLRFDPKTEGYTTYTTRDGLPDNVVQCILPDQAGNLWLSTNRGISRFDLRDGSFSNFHESDGLQGEQFNRKACFADSSGMLHFGGVHGFNAFDPQQIPARPPEAGPVILTELRIHGSVAPVRPGTALPKPLWEMETLNLSHRENGFSLEFAAMNFRDRATTRYRFKLEGLEKEWTEVDSRIRSARYTDLRPGQHRFRVQASTDGRTWNRQEASIGIAIGPPWWMTPWSRGSALLALAGLLTGAYQLRVRAQREKEMRLQKLVDLRTAELVEARNQAVQASSAKSVFLANMSHELRTPLNAILGFSNLLRDRSDSPEQRRDLDIINRSGEHLLSLIDGVLDVARIEAGHTKLDLGRCDAARLVREVAEMMRVRAAQKQLSLVLKKSRESPAYVRVDGPRLREVLINLVGNAIKYTERGVITLRFDARHGEGDSALLRFEVEDTGIGIASEDRERIFEPFEQVTTAGGHGAGLGLSITRQLVELMGGKIDMVSELGQGTCFRVEIPAEWSTEAEEKAFGRERVLGLAPGQPEYRVLVVEDELENWMLLSRLLRDAGFSVRLANDGEQGVEAFQEWRPHFIWMDLRMPVMDGIEATRRIRSLAGGRDVKIAAVSASAFESQRTEAQAAGLDDYLLKPYRPGEIFDCMARLLGAQYVTVATRPAGERPTTLSPEAVATLPADMRAELRDAVTALDEQRISRAVQAVAERDAALGAALSEHANRFAYTTILLAVKGGGGDPGSAAEAREAL